MLAGVPAMPQAPNNPPTPKHTSNPDTLTFSRTKLESKIAHTERNLTDPNALAVAVMLRGMF